MSSKASLLEETCAEQYRNDKECQKNKEQHLGDRGSPLSDPSESEYRGDNRNDEKYDGPT
jgi:hypothetical protein